MPPPPSYAAAQWSRLGSLEAESLTRAQVLGIVSNAFHVVVGQGSEEAVVVCCSAFQTLMGLLVTRGSP